MKAFPAGIEQKADPLVQPARAVLVFLLAAQTVAGVGDTRTPVSTGHTSLSHDAAAGSIAWVDFDVEPARLVFDSFSQRFAAHAKGRTVLVRFVGADVANPVRLRVQMQQLLQQHPTVVVATSVTVAQTLQALHPRTPIYFIIQSDPLRDGLVNSLRSTGSLTGYTFFVPLDVKTMEVINRIFPHARVGIVTDAFWLEGRSMSLDLFARCRSMGIELVTFQVESAAEVDRLPADPRVRGIDVWYIPYSTLAFDDGQHIAQVLAKTPAATVYARRKFLKDGGLLSIQTVDPGAMDTWAKTLLDILDGVPIGSIPVMRPKEIEITANAVAAARLDAATRRRIAAEITRLE